MTPQIPPRGLEGAGPTHPHPRHRGSGGGWGSGSRRPGFWATRSQHVTCWAHGGNQPQGEGRQDRQRPGRHRCWVPVTQGAGVGFNGNIPKATYGGDRFLCVSSPLQDSQAPPFPSLMFLDRSRQGPPRGLAMLASALVFVQALKNQCPCLIKPLGAGLHGNHCTWVLDADEYLFN